VVGIELGDQRLTLEMRGERVNRGRHHATGTTPVGVKVDGDRNVTFIYSACESFVVQSDGALEKNRLCAFATLGPVGDLARVDPVPRITELATHRELLTRCFGFGRRFRLGLHSILELSGLGDDNSTTAKFAAGRIRRA